MNIYGVLADLISALHLVYIGVVLLGQLAIMIGWPLGWRWIRNPWFRGIHLVMILIVAAEAVVDFQCPLTTWELQLRVLAGQRGAGAQNESPGFIAECIDSVMTFDKKWESVLQAGYYITAGIIVATVFLVPPRFRRTPVSIPAVPPVEPDAPTITEAATVDVTADGKPS